MAQDSTLLVFEGFLKVMNYDPKRKMTQYVRKCSK